MFLTIDIGGTKTLLALFNSRGHCLRRLKFPTNHDASDYIESLHNNLQEFIPRQLTRRHVRAITVAIPGIVTHESNAYSFKLGNLNWPNIDLITPIKNLFNCKIFFVNDANLATLYEANQPDCKSSKAIYLTFSTGIGGGIAKNGHLLTASDTFEPGHVKYIYQGHSLEWEDIAAAKALVSAYKCQTLEGLSLDSTRLNDLVDRLSFGLIDIVKHETPDIIIIGGPICFIFDEFKQPLLDKLSAELKLDVSFRLKKAHRPTESVIYGGYLYSKQNYRK